jgi:hypothetical protein
LFSAFFRKAPSHITREKNKNCLEGETMSEEREINKDKNNKTPVTQMNEEKNQEKDKVNEELLCTKTSLPKHGTRWARASISHTERA